MEVLSPRREPALRGAVDRSRGRFVAAASLALVAASLSLTGCRDPLVDDSPDPGFVAVVTDVKTVPGVSPGKDWSLAIRELSGTYPVDRSETLQPGDTVIFTVPPASYDLRLSNLPVGCGNRFGLGRRAVVFESGQTSIVRYNIQCAPLLTVATSTDGYDPDDEYVYRLLNEAETEVRRGVISSTDTLPIDSIAPGRYVVELAHVSPNCVVISEGGHRVSVEAVAPLHPLALFRVRCSDPEYRPTIERVEATVTDGASALYVSARDPGSAIAGFPDLDRFVVDVTDCHGRSLLPGGSREYRGLRVPGSRLVGEEIVRFVFVLPGDVPPAPAGGERCMAVRLQDFEGNSTPIVGDRLDRVRGAPPTATSFDVSLVDPSGGDPRYRVDMEIEDPDGDVAGAFLMYELRDGALGQPQDGTTEKYLPNVIGWDRAFVPDQRLAVLPFTPDDLLAVRVYVMDLGGNVLSLSDSDLGP